MGECGFFCVLSGAQRLKASGITKDEVAQWFILRIPILS